MPDDVTDRGADTTRRELEDVVPVTADEAIVSGEVTGGDLQAADLGQARQQAALGRRCDRLARGPVDEQDGGRVDLEDLSYPFQQGVEELVDLEVSERCVGHRLYPPELLGFLLEIGIETR